MATSHVFESLTLALDTLLRSYDHGVTIVNISNTRFIGFAFSISLTQRSLQAHPDWEWVLWTDKDNFDLVRKHAPWFLPTYKALGDDQPVFYADAVRNLYMHVFGGYANLHCPKRENQRFCKILQGPL